MVEDEGRGRVVMCLHTQSSMSVPSEVAPCTPAHTPGSLHWGGGSSALDLPRYLLKT